MPKVQFIGYKIQTAANGNKKLRKAYPGLLLAEDDIKARCRVLMDAIDAAAKDTKIDRDAKKIFAAPEFFFRGGLAGAYPVAKVSLINETLDRHLSAVTFKDWTFVLGTALAFIPAANGKTEMMNISLVRRGGVRVTGGRDDAQGALATASADSRLVYKEYISALDFFGPNYDEHNAFLSETRNGAQGYFRGKVHTLMPTSGARPSGGVAHTDPPNLHVEDHTTSEKSRTGLGGGVDFEMSGMHFALEICADHVAERACRTVKRENIDVHLVTSCGMTRKNQCCKVGGFFFIVDGSGAHLDAQAYTFRLSSMKRLSRRSSIDMRERKYWKHCKNDATVLFEAGRGTVVIFEAKELPPPST